MNGVAAPGNVEVGGTAIFSEALMGGSVTRPAPWMMYKITASITQTTPPVPSDRQRIEGLEQDGDSAWQERVLALAVELRGSLTSAELHETIARKLPPLIGVDQLWIETSVGGRRKVISSPISSEGPTIHPLLETAGEWATFPLRSADAIVGVIGVPITHRPLAPAARRALASLAPLLGDSLQTAHTIAQLRDLSTIDSVTGCSTRPESSPHMASDLGL